jgi:phosphinothricin acetyltransferase
LLSKLVELLERQGFVAVIGAIALPNEASVALHESLGFVHSGTYRGVGFKLGEWIDVGLWQRDLAPRMASPSDPVSAEGLG